jgi:hypothetical protein
MNRKSWQKTLKYFGISFLILTAGMIAVSIAGVGPPHTHQLKDE